MMAPSYATLAAQSDEPILMRIIVEERYFFLTVRILNVGEYPNVTIENFCIGAVVVFKLLFSKRLVVVFFLVEAKNKFWATAKCIQYSAKSLFF